MNRLFLSLKAKLNDYGALQQDFFGIIKGRWVPEENLHMTLCYFGDNYSVEELVNKIPELVEPIEPLKLSSLGCFGDKRILYAKTKSEKLKMLQSSISTSFSLANAKPFNPHITLMRIKSIENSIAFNQMLNKYENKTIGSLDTTLQLMQSHIKHPGGAEYECIKRF